MDNLAGQQLDFSIVSPRLTVEAMRDSGYKDTDHALAELIDNSIEARATLVEVIAVEKLFQPDKPFARPRIFEIAVADNGEGMDRTTLRRALRFGDGTRLGNQRRGMGRFGIGLPLATISQCRRVDIWTWQNGPSNSFHCYLSIDEVEEGATQIPNPTLQPVPDKWLMLSSSTSETTGTLVVWSCLDRVRWKGGKTTLTRTEELCGRIYRKFITDPDHPITIELKLANADIANVDKGIDRRTCLPNDPLYLLETSSTPPPFDSKPMFRLYNDRTWEIKYNGQTGTIKVKCAMAKPDAINERKSEIEWPKSYAKAGQSPWGKHADRNKGISIVRAQRELTLSQAWVNSYEPEERWWTVEVEFDPVLDEIFGVVNNKQHAHIFETGAGFNWEEIAEQDETYSELLDRLDETDDPRSNLIEVWIWIDKQITQMRKERKKIMEGTGSSGNTRHPTTGETVEDVATNIINEQAEKGEEKGETDYAPNISDDEKIEEIEKSARQVRVDPDTAREWAISTVESGRRVLMKAVTLGHKHAFFNVQTVSDIIEVWLNDQHPVYEHFIEVITSGTQDQDFQELSDRINKAAFTLQMLIYAWARYEDKAPPRIREQLEDARMAWGREASRFFEPIES